VTPAQEAALTRPALLAIEGLAPDRWLRHAGDWTEILTVQRGYECTIAGYGGPVWHASAASMRLRSRQLRGIVRHLLAGVGRPEHGEWKTTTRRDRLLTVHFRRRLSPAEALVSGPILDIRGTRQHAEVAERVAAVLPGVDAETLMAWEMGTAPILDDTTMAEMFRSLQLRPRT